MNTIVKQYRSFKRDEFVEYFSSISTHKDGDYYCGSGWRVLIGEEKMDMVGSISFRAVEIIIVVNEEIEDAFINELRIRFLRGGG